MYLLLKMLKKIDSMFLLKFIRRLFCLDNISKNTFYERNKIHTDQNIEERAA